MKSVAEKIHFDSLMVSMESKVLIGELEWVGEGNKCLGFVLYTQWNQSFEVSIEEIVKCILKM